MDKLLEKPVKLPVFPSIQRHFLKICYVEEDALV
jgi:hypothetical protein